MSTEIKITFWGVRGSLPDPLSPGEMRERQRELIREIRRCGLPARAEEEHFLDELPAPIRGLVGGNTSCVEVSIGDQILIFDAGSGIRPLGQRLMQGPCGQGKGHLRIFLSHTHWDHIQGLPYFPPIYVPGNQIEIYSGFDDIAERIDQQQRQEFFPIPVSALSANLSYHVIPPGSELGLPVSDGFPPGAKIQVHELCHPGGAHGYRLEADNSAVVYATDADYCGLEKDDLQRHIQFFRRAVVLIFDAHFSFEEALSHREWGHASSIMGVSLACQAQVRKLVLFHHSPDNSDQMLYELMEKARAYQQLNLPEADLDIILATEGLTLKCGN